MRTFQVMLYVAILFLGVASGRANAEESDEGSRELRQSPFCVVDEQFCGLDLSVALGSSFFPGGVGLRAGYEVWRFTPMSDLDSIQKEIGLVTRSWSVFAPPLAKDSSWKGL
jgi:hypothetical protein